MSKRLLVGHAEYLEAPDYERFTTFPQAAIDAVVGDVVGYPAHWAGFTVARRSAQEVTISAGRFYNGGIVYEADSVQTLNLTSAIPVNASDERWIALILRGGTRTHQEERAFETSEDPAISEPVSIPTPKIEMRECETIVQLGQPTPAPAVPPGVAETDACIAYVRITTQGVQDIQPGERWRAKSLFEVEGRVERLEVRLDATLARTEVLETGMTNANAAIDELRRGQIRPEVFRQVRRDVAAIRRQVDVPEGARSDWYDPGLLYDYWGATHASWLARIDEGVQFPYTQRSQTRLEVRSEGDPRLSFSRRRMVPAWNKVKRIANEGGGSTRLISQEQHTEIKAYKRSVSRTRTDYGPTVNVCENAAEWARFAPFLHAGQRFTKDDEEFEVIGFVQDGWPNGPPGHNIYAVRSVKKTEWSETYWEYLPIEIGLNGSVYGQTFLVDQPLICPSIELEFASIGTGGAVHVFICNMDETGAPIIYDILAEAKLEQPDLSIGWNEFVCDLTYFEPGKRYAWFAVTTGNHQLRGTDGNAYTGGTSFRFTDGAWAQGDLDFDFNFRVNGCRFINTRTVVDFKSMTLPGGMTEFSLLYPSWTPEGTAISWEVQPVFGGEDQPWRRVSPFGGANALVGLPAMVNLRATMLATNDLAPMIELSADAVSTTGRVGDRFLAPSERIDLGITTDRIETLTVVDDFNPAIHTFTPRIMVNDGPTLVAPTNSITAIDQDRPSRRTITSFYDVPAGTRYVRNAPGGTTTNVVDVFFIQNTALFAL